MARTIVFWAAFAAVMIPLYFALRWVAFDVLTPYAAGLAAVAIMSFAAGYLVGNHHRVPDR